MKRMNECSLKEKFQSGWQDSNLRPPGPKPGAITGLRYAPSPSGGEGGIRTLGTTLRSYDGLANR